MLGAPANIAAERKRRALRTPEIPRHLVMIGNPGTGKKTVAQLLGRFYNGYGLLETGRMVEASRGEFIAEYVGMTAQRTAQVVEKALGGVLYIHEAFMLEPRIPTDFGQEAIDTLTASMENHRNDLCVVMAGSAEPMRQLLQAQPGLAGRFGATLVFPDYSDDELLEVLRRYCESSDYVLSESAEQRCRNAIAEARALLSAQFDNTRMVRRLFERAVAAGSTSVETAGALRAHQR